MCAYEILSDWSGHDIAYVFPIPEFLESRESKRPSKANKRIPLKTTFRFLCTKNEAKAIKCMIMAQSYLCIYFNLNLIALVWDSCDSNA
jgi:hypothetical protein